MSAVLAVVVGVAFMLLLLSLLASAVVEGMAGVFRLRSAMLERALFAVLTGVWERRARRPSEASTDRVASFFADPTIATGSPKWLGKDFRASYLPAEHFAELVFTHYLGGVRATTETVHGRIGAMVAGEHATIDRVLTRLWEDAGHDVAALRDRLERHYEDTMNRVSGWYRRRTRWMLFGCGVVLAVGFNVGLLSMVHTLWADSAVRNGLDAVARQTQAPGDLTTNLANAGTALRHASDLGLPIGWGNRSAPSGAGSWLAAVIGWIAVGIGVSFGAPFWFDVLGRFVNLRLAGPGATRAGTPAGTGARAGAGRTPGSDGRDDPVPAPAPASPAPAEPGPVAAPAGPVMTRFDPSVHGFHFDNDFENQFPQPFGSMHITTYGRCGGMVYAGLDLYRTGRAVPATNVLPADDSPLARYLLARLFDSWANASATRFLTLTMADDIDLDHTTRRELAALYQRIDGGEPAPLGLISARTLAEVGYCHQVLAVGYERLPDGTVVVYTWDNNHADAMTTLTLRPDRLGVVSNQRTNPYRGLFVHTYAARTPPDDLSAG